MERIVSESHPKLIDLKASAKRPLLRRLLSLLEFPLEATLSIRNLNRSYARAMKRHNRDNFFRTWLEEINAGFEISDADIEKIPRKGPVVVVCNHPFGGLDGILLGDLFHGIRKDVKFLGNYLLQKIPEMQDRVIAVDPFASKSSARANVKGLREAIRWVEDGGALVTFPAGEVSHLKLREIRISDGVWSPHVAAVIRRARASVLPLYIRGRNSALFQLAGLVHPLLRTALLPRELMNKADKRYEIFSGKCLPWKTLKRYTADEKLVLYLRAAVDFLSNRTRTSRFQTVNVPAPPPKEFAEPLIDPVDPVVLQEEIDGLPEENILVESGEFAVVVARAERIPNVLKDLGRLRELTFRGVGEGTGKPLDLDRFDDHYEHLFLWNREARELVGSYRMGPTEEILQKHGPDGLYTSTLFKFQPEFFPRVMKGLELGRSFIRPEYQRKHSCLGLLWGGIGEYIMTMNRDVHILFGPVSISRDYQPVSKNLMVQFLSETRHDGELSQAVAPRYPYRMGRRDQAETQAIGAVLRDIEDVSVLISEVEADGKGIPVLFRQYIKMDARILCFNVDPDFSDVVDGLMYTDLHHTDPRLMRRFMGRDRYASWCDHQGISK